MKDKVADVSWVFQFRAGVDDKLVALRGKDVAWTVSVRSGALFLEGHNREMKFALDMEDTATLTDRDWHFVAITTSAGGTKIYLDGYQCFSTTADLAPTDLAPGDLASGDLAPGHSTLGHSTSNRSTSAEGGSAALEIVTQAGSEVRGLETRDGVLTSTEILAMTPPPTPLIEFAAARLCAYDIASVAALPAGSVFLRFRVRGPGQQGTMLAASGGGIERLNVSITARGLEYRVLAARGEWRSFLAKGHWDEGNWHDVVLRVGHGAVQIYVDGYLEAHLPGQAFFGAIGECDDIVIGQDTSGARLFGEVRHAAIYANILNDAQIKHLSSVAPVETQCLFDAGFHDSVSYRIPSLVALKSGTVVAGADQRETIANDSPNSINFTIRRSFDGGNTWGDSQTVLSYPGGGATGSSATDSCMVQDRHTGRLIVLLDHFPGAIGQPNAQTGTGVDENGNYLLYDGDGASYTWLPDGNVVDGQSQPAPYWIAKNGDVTVTRGGVQTPGGNVFLADGEDPRQTLLTKRTCFLQMIYSDDDGATWSRPRNLNHQVKAEWMSFCGASPGTGIQLVTPKHRGRLVMPIYYNGANRTYFRVTTVYSDDGGETWQRGKAPDTRALIDQLHQWAKSAAGKAEAGEPEPGEPEPGEPKPGEPKPGKAEPGEPESAILKKAALYESTLVQRLDGSILMLMRNQHPSGKVAAAISQDGGETWGEVYFVDEIPEIFCQPNAVAWPTPDCPERVIFANASQLRPYRGRGVLRLSEDGGRTWIASRTFNPAHYVYQCMAIMPDGDLGLLWEREMQGLYFTKLPLEWINAAK